MEGKTKKKKKDKLKMDDVEGEEYQIGDTVKQKKKTKRVKKEKKEKEHLRVSN